LVVAPKLTSSGPIKTLAAIPAFGNELSWWDVAARCMRTLLGATTVKAMDLVVPPLPVVTISRTM
jgi:hypothetical protein